MTSISTAARNAAGAAITNLIDVGSAAPNGYIEVRTGTKPANPATAATGTLLAVFNMSNPAFGTWINGTSLANPISADTDIDANGVAGWFRVYSRDGVAIYDGTITATGGGGDAEFDNVNFLEHGTAQMSSLSLTMPQDACAT
jgi:hypothetical protein